MCREIVVSGLVGYERKLKHKKLHGIPIYRSNKFSLRDRVNRKLTEKYNWFRTKKNENCDENEKQINVRSKPSPMKVKKVPRSKVKLKLSPKVKSPVKKLGAQKRSMSPELSTEIGSPEQDQSTIIGSPAPELGIETGSPDPKLCNNIGSPSPIQGAERGSVIPDSETERVSSTSNRGSNSLASGLHPDMVDSPSLRPVKIKNIIDNFESNFKKGQC